MNTNMRAVDSGGCVPESLWHGAYLLYLAVPRYLLVCGNSTVGTNRWKKGWTVGSTQLSALAISEAEHEPCENAVGTRLSHNHHT